jgi:hypothetical protein
MLDDLRGCSDHLERVYLVTHSCNAPRNWPCWQTATGSAAANGSPAAWQPADPDLPPHHGPVTRPRSCTPPHHPRRSTLGPPGRAKPAVEGRVSRVKRSAIGKADARRALLAFAPEAPTSGKPGGCEYVLAASSSRRYEEIRTGFPRPTPCVPQPEKHFPVRALLQPPACTARRTLPDGLRRLGMQPHAKPFQICPSRTSLVAEHRPRQPQMWVLRP